MIGSTLLRRLKIALEEREAQVRGFEEVDGSLQNDLRDEWRLMVDVWVKDHSKPNPYAPSGRGMFRFCQCTHYLMFFSHYF